MHLVDVAKRYFWARGKAWAPENIRLCNKAKILSFCRNLEQERSKLMDMRFGKKWKERVVPSLRAMVLKPVINVDARAATTHLPQNSLQPRYLCSSNSHYSNLRPQQSADHFQPHLLASLQSAAHALIRLHHSWL